MRAQRNLSEAKLAGSRLVAALLAKTDLRDADLSRCNLERADLQEADLSRAQLLGADLQGARLTGACLAGWNIDGDTRLQDAEAEYVFLEEGFQQRQPPEGNFAPGEFARLFQAVADTLDFVVTERYELDALLATLRRLRGDGAEGLEVASVEMRQDSTLVKVSAPPQLDREAVYAEVRQKFEVEKLVMAERLKGLEQQTLLLGDLLKDAINRPINVTAQGGHAVDHSRHQTISNATLTGVNFNQGEQGDVSIVLGHLPDDAPAELKTTLEQLHAALQSTPHLDDDSKAMALQQVEHVAKAAAQPEAKRSLLSAAFGMLKQLSEGAKDAGVLAAEVGGLIATLSILLGL